MRTRQHTRPRPTRRMLTAAGLGVLALALTGCASLTPASTADERPGSAGGDATPEADGSRDPGALPVLEITHTGGFVPIGWHFANVAEITIYEDGTVVVHGPTTLEHPGRLLPNLLTHELTPEELDALLTAAREAGLLTDAPDYGTPPIADAGATRVTLTVDGTTWVHSAEALDYPLDDADGSMLDDDAREARTVLTEFVEDVREAVADAEETGTYTPDAYAVMAMPSADTEAPAADDVAAPASHAWPLDVALGEATCVVVDGADAATLAPVLADARLGDRFVQDGSTYEVFVRVMLPGDPGCQGDEALPAP